MRAKARYVRAAYGILLGLTATIMLWLLLQLLLPQTERYVSQRSSAEIPVLWGFSQESLVNVGNAKQLDALPGVGEVISQRMIEIREQLGGFRLPEDLMLVKGIGEKTFQKIMEALDEPLIQLTE